MPFNDADFELAKIRFSKLNYKAKVLQIQDNDIKSISFMKRHEESSFNVLTFIIELWIRFAIIIIVTALVLLAAVKGSIIEAKTVALWSTYITGNNLDTDPCIIELSETMLDPFRPPVECSFCKGLSDIEKVSNLSQKKFEEKYAYSGIPIIVTDGAKNWSALDTFSFDYIESVYTISTKSASRQVCQFFPYKTKFKSLDDVFQMPFEMKQMKSEPWYIGWSNCDPDVANILRKHYNRPYFLSIEMESSHTDWLFMGTPGYGAHMHIDAVQYPSWQAQIKGEKEWILKPPPECYYKCVYELRAIVKPGEIIVLDTNRWFHSTSVVGSQLSIVIGSEYD